VFDTNTWDEKEYIDDKWISRIAGKHPCCPHLWNNCRLTCVDCNLSRNNQQTYPAFGKYTPQDIEFEDKVSDEDLAQLGI